MEFPAKLGKMAKLQFGHPNSIGDNLAQLTFQLVQFGPEVTKVR
ncbi:hypothetical protein LINPERHAP1_LOCUS26759 [Linum perenne]